MEVRNRQQYLGLNYLTNSGRTTEVKNKQQNLGFSAANARVNLNEFFGGKQIIDVLLDEIVKSGASVDNYTRGHKMALRVEGTPEIEHKFCNAINGLTIKCAEIANSVEESIEKFAKDKGWVNPG